MTSLDIPVEGTYSDIEHDLIENEPPGLFPTDQSSLWGQVRKLQADYLQVIADLMTTWYGNLDPNTVNIDDMPEWEYLVNVPVAPTGKTLDERRAFVLSRWQRGPFTRTRRYQIIESFLDALLSGGPVILFTPTGLPFGTGGMYFGTGITSLTGLYRIYENIPAFTYEVWIKSSVTPDAGMLRELQRITPAGIVVSIDNSHADVLDYFRTIRNNQPIFYWRGQQTTLTNVAPAGGNVALNGTTSNLASPGLLNTNVAGSNGATILNGSSGYVTMAHYAQMNVGDTLTAGLIWKPAAIGSAQWLMDKGTGAYAIWMDSTGHIVFGKSETGSPIATSTVALSAATIYNIKVTKKNTETHIYINGVDRTGTVTDQTLGNTSTALNIGRRITGATSFANGVVDEVYVTPKALSPTTILIDYNTGIDVP